MFNFVVMRSISFLFGIVLLASCGDCLQGTGDAVAEKRTVETFETLEINGSINVSIRQALISDLNRIEVRAQENLIPHILTRIDGARLIIETDECINASVPIEVSITCTDLQRIFNNGSGNVVSTNTLKADDFDIENVGSGKMTLTLNVDDLDVENNGSGDIFLSGDAHELTLENDGSGSFDSFGMKTFIAKVTNDGSGTVELRVKDELNAELNGSGNILYKGNPQEVNLKSNGSGNIQKAD
ncbi:MAG: hypothetical protein GC193_07995 [Cryomorphaceae bacterium]|nr:hypothetical protein [Cryomorphaceae bacterium]